jgi:hypothetical protein
MFGEVFDLLEDLTATFATVLVGRHGASPSRKPGSADRMGHVSDLRCIHSEF